MAQVVGRRIRQRRQELGLTLRELAGRVGKTAGYLSRVETDHATPTFDALKDIAKALGVPLLYFVDAQTSGPLMRANERPRISLPHTPMTYEPLTPEWCTTMRALLTRMQPGAYRTLKPLSGRNDQLLFVVSGHLLLDLDGTIHDLYPHDSIYYDGNLARSYTAGEGEEMVALVVVVPPVA